MLDSKSRDQSDSNVPLSERGKGENMHLDERSPDSVFGIVGLAYMLILLFIVLGIAFWVYI